MYFKPLHTKSRFVRQKVAGINILFFLYTMPPPRSNFFEPFVCLVRKGQVESCEK